MESGGGGLLSGLTPGSRIAGYLLEEQVGAGGMAVVFRAVDERLGRQVALKVLAPALASDEAFRQRFIRESRAAAAVDDPHIVPVYEAGEAGGVLFIAMRYVAGGDVHGLLYREGPLPADRVAAIISPVASALDAAHAAGLVHRDVKPTNMLLDVRPERPDHVYLSDFGLSKGVLSSATLTGLGYFLGTPDYIAPEQIEGKPLTGQADQYALACAAFEMLTGQAPFRRDEANVVIWSHLSVPPPPLTSLRPGLPAAADQVFARAMAKAPGDRYPRCADFAEALRRAFGLAPYAHRAIPLAEPPAPDHPPVRAAWAAEAAATRDSPAVRGGSAQTAPAMSEGAGAATGPGPAGSGAGPAATRRWLAAGAAVLAVVAVYLVIAAAAHAFPFAKPAHRTIVQPTTPVTPIHHVTPATSPVSRIVPVAWLLPADVPLSSCSQGDASSFNFAIIAPTQVLSCQRGNWSVVAVQTDNSADYMTTLQNFNKWVSVDPSSAGTNCPPQGGSSQGIVAWSNKSFPRQNDQTLECFTYISGGSPFPSYVWSFPTEHAFLWATGNIGTSFSALDTWWKDNELRTVAPSPPAS